MRSGSSMRPGGSLAGVSVSALLLYSMWITVLAVATSDPRRLGVLALLTGLPGLLLGYRRYGILVPLLGLSLLGTFLNMLLLYNVGEPVFSLGPLTVREEAWSRTVSLNLRILTLAGTGLLFASTVNPRDAVRSLERELGMPRGLAFALSFSLRLLPLVYRDLQEVMAIRRMRGYRRVPVTPGDYRSLFMPLLSVAIERGVWVGVAAELRGFSSRPRTRVRPRFRRGDGLLLLLGLLQTLVVAGVL